MLTICISSSSAYHSPRFSNQPADRPTMKISTFAIAVLAAFAPAVVNAKGLRNLAAVNEEADPAGRNLATVDEGAIPADRNLATITEEEEDPADRNLATADEEAAPADGDEETDPADRKLQPSSCNSYCAHWAGTWCQGCCIARPECCPGGCN